MCRHKSTGGLGFRDLRDFNLALLGKQAWRFISQPNSLVSRVFKAKYFSKSHFLDAELGFNPSYKWRSIWEARIVILARARWKVGLGTNIKIVGQPWLPDDQNSYVTSISPALCDNTVSNLLSLDSKTWDEDILRDLFNDRDQQCIRSIKLNEEEGEDILYWCKENSGLYTVKSAYRLLLLRKNLWQHNETSSIWCRLWKIKALPKVINCMWRALSHCFPTLSMLWSRYVPVVDICPVCNATDESIFHALVTCHFAQQCWNVDIPEVRVDVAEDFSGWLSYHFNTIAKERHAEIAVLCWAIWKA